MGLSHDARSLSVPKLPLGTTIGLAYSTYSHGFKDVLQISWLWLAVLAPLTGLANWLQVSWIASVAKTLKPGMVPSLTGRPIGMLVLVYAGSLVFLLAGLSIAVAWHRRELLGEHPAASGHNVVTASLWRYALSLLLLGLIVMGPMLAIMLPIFFWVIPQAVHGAQPAGLPVLLILVMATVVAATAVAVRLMPVLPARAIGDVAVTFKDVWNRTRGNIWRLYWGTLACLVPPMLVMQIIFLSLIGFGDPRRFADDGFVWRMTIVSTLVSLCYLLVLPIWVGFLSHTYRHFFPRPERGT